MKRKFACLILTLVLAAGLCVPARAASAAAEEAADALHTLGLFNGVGTQADGTPIYDLDRTLSRQEAVAMLVRLLGKEEEAKSGAWETPFADVADWAAPYVGYAYAHKLTNGVGETVFGGNQAVSATQYITFVLRALGYSSETDFAWDTAWEKSDELGITCGNYSAANNSGFLRGDAVLVSASVLSAGMKDGGGILLEALIAAGAVTAEAAWASGLLPDEYTLYARELLTMAKQGQTYTFTLPEDRMSPVKEIAELVPNYDMHFGGGVGVKPGDPRPLETLLVSALRNYTGECLDGNYVTDNYCNGTHSFRIFKDHYSGFLITDGKGTIRGFGYCNGLSDDLTVVTFTTDSRAFIDSQVKAVRKELDKMTEVEVAAAAEDGKYIYTFTGLPESAVWMYDVSRGELWNGSTPDRSHLKKLLLEYYFTVAGWLSEFAFPAAESCSVDAEAHDSRALYVYRTFFFFDKDYRLVGYGIGVIDVREV